MIPARGSKCFLLAGSFLSEEGLLQPRAGHFNALRHERKAVVAAPFTKGTVRKVIRLPPIASGLASLIKERAYTKSSHHKRCLDQHYEPVERMNPSMLNPDGGVMAPDVSTHNVLIVPAATHPPPSPLRKCRHYRDLEPCQSAAIRPSSCPRAKDPTTQPGSDSKHLFRSKSSTARLRGIPDLCPRSHADQLFEAVAPHLADAVLQPTLPAHPPGRL